MTLDEIRVNDHVIIQNYPLQELNGMRVKVSAITARGVRVKFRLTDAEGMEHRENRELIRGQFRKV